MNYTIKQFQKDFPNDDACLDYIFKARYGRDFICPKCSKKGFYRIKTRKCYGCAWCGYQIYPARDTIFNRSSTSLYNWFFAIYLMSKGKNGVSAKEIQDNLGTTYKTAWRIAKLIRSLMKPDDEMLDKTVEIDEMYVGGRRKEKNKRDNKTMVVGMVKRGGKVKAKCLDEYWTPTVLKTVIENVERGTRLITDDSPIYHKTKRLGFLHDSITHSKKIYVRGDIHTNTIEGFWSQVKRSLHGTYHSVSPKYLQDYINQFTYHYNKRFSSSSAFEDLLLRLVAGQHGSKGYQSVPSGVRVSS